MKKILITRKLLKAPTEKASKIFDVKLNNNDELYSQAKLIELSQGCDAILTSITDKMMMDAVGGKIDGQNFTSVSSTSTIPAKITVSMDNEVGSKFEALAFFLPSYSYSATKKEYSNYMQKGQVSASFDNINVTIPVNMVEPR